MVAIAAAVDKRGGNAIDALVLMLETMRLQETEAFGVASPRETIAGKSVEKLRIGKIKANIALGCVFSPIPKKDNPQLTKLENATMVFGGRMFTTKPKFPANLSSATAYEKTAASILKTEGSYAFTIAEPHRVIAGRDVMGAYPLYYGENSTLAAFATQRKALWKVKIEKAESCPPGHLTIANQHGFTFKAVKTLPFPKPKPISLWSASRRLGRILEKSVKQNVKGLKEIAVPFSGGLDSTLIAFLAKKTADVQLIHVSLERQPETLHAKAVAEELKLPIHVRLYGEEDVAKVLPDVLWIAEASDPLDAAIGVPVYWVSETAKHLGFNVLLSGQGADELFGGYRRHVEEYLEHGREKAEQALFNDVADNSKKNLERD
ncbi:MAG: asparagine synthase-related protein, partial [Candidatus Bathyarchaeia archaeon]